MYCVVLPCGWRWGRGVLCPLGDPAACWFSGSGAWCWWPWWNPSALANRRSSSLQDARSPRKPRPERRRRTWVLSANKQVWKHKNYSLRSPVSIEGITSTKWSTKLFFFLLSNILCIVFKLLWMLMASFTKIQRIIKNVFAFWQSVIYL